MKKIVFCHDFLFHDSSNVGTYHVWMFDLFKPLMEECGVKEFIELKYLKNKKGELFSRDMFFELSGIEHPDISYFSYDIEKINQTSLNYLKSFLNDDVFIFGVELGMDMRLILDKFKIPFINFWIHSFKLCDDILLMINTNKRKIYDVLQKYKVSENMLKFNANYWKIYMQENKMIKDQSLRYNSVLFIGQTPIDQSVEENGKYHNITDFKDRIAELSQEYKHIYYQEHPLIKSYSKTSKGYQIISEINDYIEKTPYISKLKVNISTYALLASDKIEKVVALSSSVLYEAQFFGKKTEYLFRPLFDIDGKFGLNTFTSVFASYYSPKFWYDILSTEFQKLNQVTDVQYMTCGKNKLRELKQLYWGYKNFDLLRKTADTVEIIAKKVNVENRHFFLKNVEEIMKKLKQVKISDFLKKLHLSLPLNKEILFNKDFEYLISLHGFGLKETWGVWSIQEEAFLKFRVPSKRYNYCLYLTVKPWLNKDHKQMRVSVYVNKKFFKHLDLVFPNLSEKQIILIPLEKLKERKVYVDFKFDGICSPKSLGINDDARKLGFGLISARLERTKKCSKD